MRSIVLLLVVMTARVAAADATQDLVVEYTRIARDVRDCAAIRDIGDKVKALDPAYYARAFATDPIIAKCLEPAVVVPTPEPIQMAPSETPPVPAVARPAELPVVPRSGTPPVDGGHVVGQVLLGLLATGAGAIGGAYLGYATCSDRSGDFACFGNIVIGGYLGAVVLTAGGVYAAGNSSTTRGSFGYTLLGSFLGSGVGILVAVSAANGGNDGGNAVAAGFVVASPTIGAILGFQASRRWNDPAPRVGSLLRLDGGKVSLGMPVVVRSQTQGHSVTTLPLFSGSF